MYMSSTHSIRVESALSTDSIQEVSVPYFSGVLGHTLLNYKLWISTILQVEYCRQCAEGFIDYFRACCKRSSPV